MLPPSSIWKMNLYSCENACDFIIMQYTGLKDKNGKEIYDGDVIKSSRTGLNYHVQWDDEDSGFKALCVDQKKDFGMHPYGWNDDSVIGNIHENPDLLA